MHLQSPAAGFLCASLACFFGASPEIPDHSLGIGFDVDVFNSRVLGAASTQPPQSLDLKGG